MQELSYSFHLSNDKNKSIKAKQKANTTESGTTSYNNNAIQNIRHLGKVNHHNLRQYDNNGELIKTIKGSNDIVNDVKDLYLDIFEEARLYYNLKQTREDRKIDNYFNKISSDDKHDLACEIIIELGDMNFWEDKAIKEKYKMVNVFENQLKDLKEIVPDFYVANATIHFDEASPHLHIVGVPVKENCKTGLQRQVGKTSIFTKESLVNIQDKMRECCIKEFNKEYSENSKLKEKRKGQNRDYTPYERLKFNEKAQEIKKDISNLKEEVSNLENNKLSLNKDIKNLNKDKEDISIEIDKKKKLNNKIIIKSKNQLWEDNKKLEGKISSLEYENYDYKRKYNDLKEKTDYLIYHLSKIINILPTFIKDIIDRLFIHNNISFQLFKQQYDSEVLEKNKKIEEKQERNRKLNIFNRTKNYDYENDNEFEKKNDDFELECVK